MGWQDSLAKHHPIPAFFAAVISNVITGKKADEDQNSGKTNYDSDYDQHSSSDHDHAYGPSEFQPPQYYYPPPQTPSRSSYKKPKKKKNMAYNDGYEEDYYNNNNNINYDGTSYEPVVKSKGLWGRKDEHLREKGKGYGVRGTVTRSYTDWKGEEVTEEREYEYQSYYELQMTPARVVDKGKNRSTDYQGAGRSRYYYDGY